MRCDTNFEVLMAYLDGDLDPLERGRLAEHIVGCEECRRTVGDLRAVSGALAKWVAPEPTAMPTATELLERAGISRPVPASAPPAQNTLKRWLPAAALVAIAATIGLVALNQLGSDRATETAGARPEANQVEAPAAQAPDAKPGAGTVAPANTSATTAVAPAPPAAPMDPASGDKKADTSVEEQPVPQDAPKPAAPGADATPAPEEPPPPPPATGGAPAAQPTPEPKTSTEDARAIAGEREEQAASRAAPKRKVAKAAGQSAQIRDGSMTLTVDDADSAVSQIEAAARMASGSTSGGGSTVRRGGKMQRIIVVRVPSERFDETYARIRGLGASSSEMRSSRDISDRLDVTDDEKERDALIDQARTATIRVTVVSDAN